MTRVLVTGASGFIGRAAVAALLSRGAEVHAVGRRAANPIGSEHWHSADLLDVHAAQALIGQIIPDAVLHLAWIVEHGKFWTSTENLAWVSASAQLAKLAHSVGTRRFVGTGTCYEYDHLASSICSERSTTLRPGPLYGVAKDATRRLIESFAEQVGLSFAWARLFFLYGPFEVEHRLVPSVARALIAGETAKCSSGRVIRDFMDVNDAGDALAAITLGTIAGSVNVGSGTAVSISTVVSILGSLAGRPDLLALGTIPDRPNEPARIVADVTRLRSETDARPCRHFEDGLRSALDYWAAEAKDAKTP